MFGNVIFDVLDGVGLSRHTDCQLQTMTKEAETMKYGIKMDPMLNLMAMGRRACLRLPLTAIPFRQVNTGLRWKVRIYIKLSWTYHAGNMIDGNLDRRSERDLQFVKILSLELYFLFDAPSTFHSSLNQFVSNRFGWRNQIDRLSEKH